MKRILLFLNLFTVAAAVGQIPNEKLIGTWQLIAYKAPDGLAMSLETSTFKRLKIIGYGSFTVLDFNPAGNIIMTAINGGYELSPSKGIGSYELAADSNVIKETITSVSRESAGILGSNPYYGLKLDSAGLLHYSGVYETKGDETWMKVVDYRAEMLPALISKKPEDRLFKIDPRMMLILNRGDRGWDRQTVEVKPNAQFPQPLNLIKYEEVREVEFISGTEAVKRYGRRGYYGVFNLAVSEEYYDKTVKILREQKNIN